MQELFCVLGETAPNDARVAVSGDVGVGWIRHRRVTSFLLHVGVIPEKLIETWEAFVLPCNGTSKPRNYARSQLSILS